MLGLLITCLEYAYTNLLIDKLSVDKNMNTIKNFKNIYKNKKRVIVLLKMWYSYIYLTISYKEGET